MVGGYFWPILAGRLVVTVSDDAGETVISSQTIDAVLDTCSASVRDVVRPAVDIGKWAQSLSDGDFAMIPVSTDLRLDGSSSDVEQWNKLRDRFEDGLPVAVRLPLNIAERKRDGQESFVDVVLRRDGTELAARPWYIRDGILIPHARKNRSSELRGICSLLLAEDPPIASFLGDAENPAHTEWNKESANFRMKYTNGPAILDFVRRCPIEVVRLLIERDKEMDKDLLVDFFSVVDECDRSKPTTRGQAKVKRPGAEVERPAVPPPTVRPVTISEIKGGFVIRSTESFVSESSTVFVVHVAYQVRRGNPFKKYNQADFDLAQKIRIRQEGCEIEEKSGNRLAFRVKQAPFSLTVDGFDPKRDIRVRIVKREDRRERQDD